MADQVARRVAGRVGSGLVVRSFEGKSAKVTISLRPADAHKLRLASVGLGLDLGDLVTLALEPVLRSIEATVRVRGSGLADPGASEGSQDDPGPSPSLRAV
jgi:hypothetical protein